MMDLTYNEKKLLTDIMNNKYARGSFTGMVYNKTVEKFGSTPTDSQVKKMLKLALRVRLTCQELGK